MSQRLSLKATLRSGTGKNACRKLRADGKIPAVMYTPDGKNMPVTVQESELMRVYKSVGRTAIFDLAIEDAGKTITQPCIVWDAEYYPTKQRFQHIDFYGVDLEKEIKIRIPIDFSGTPKGVKIGGKLDTFRDQIHIIGKPALLPQRLAVDLSNLNINEGLRVADLKLPEGVRAHYKDNFAIVFVNAPGGAADTEENGKK